MKVSSKLSGKKIDVGNFDICIGMGANILKTIQIEDGFCGEKAIEFEVPEEGYTDFEARVFFYGKGSLRVDNLSIKKLQKKKYSLPKK